MLKRHVDTVERHLLSISRIPANAGHPLHKGTPREAFIREFLVNHLGQNMAIGSGEIIDANSKPRQPRNQFEIVLYKRDYPKLHLGGGIDAFLAESVVATIEVKSILTEQELRRAIKAAHNAKALSRNSMPVFSAGYFPPKILNFVVAYRGPANITTVHTWVDRIHSSESISCPTLPANAEERIRIASPSIDGVFILGKGFVQFDNSPSGFVSDEQRKANPSPKWVLAESSNGNLLFLFLLLLQATNNVEAAWFNPMPYLSQFRIKRMMLVS
jgi:hypothetical protein